MSGTMYERRYGCQLYGGGYIEHMYEHGEVREPQESL